MTSIENRQLNIENKISGTMKKEINTFDFHGATSASVSRKRGVNLFLPF
jgi:hypothetical protein